MQGIANNGKRGPQPDALQSTVGSGRQTEASAEAPALNFSKKPSKKK